MAFNHTSFTTPLEGLGGSNVREDDDADLRDAEDFLTPPETDYYGVLNVSRTASKDEIKDTYRRLCRAFHPDKHASNPELKRAAEERFDILHHAYEVLTDDRRRALYDEFGEEGLSIGMTIGQRYKTPEEMREEYRKIHKNRMEEQVEEMVKSKGEVEVIVDATSLFLPYKPPIQVISGPLGPIQVVDGSELDVNATTSYSRLSEWKSAIERVSTTQLSLTHSYQMAISEKFQLSMNGHMIARRGMGGGNLMGTLRYSHSSTLWTEFGASFLYPWQFTTKVQKTLSPESFITIGTKSRSWKEPPALDVTAARSISKHTVGYINYRSGEWYLGPWGRKTYYERREAHGTSSMALGLQRNLETNGVQQIMEIRTGLDDSHIHFQYSRKLRQGTRAHCNLTLSTSSIISIGVGGDTRITDHTKVGLGFECGLVNGVIVRLKASRFGQCITLPVIITPRLDIKLAFWACLVPSLGLMAIDHWVLAPRRVQARFDKLAAMREENAAYLAERKREAENTVRLLASTTARKVDAERSRGGLVIIEAFYGHFKPLNHLWSRLKDGKSVDNTLKRLYELDSVLDVTTAVQALVTDGKLILAGGYSKIHVPGIYDPCYGERKKLLIRYQFQDQMHVICIEDSAPLVCPQPSHTLHRSV
ncbi:hypothetical protein BDF19DRAFT_219992 [Syncephalis fuscata]|nr:hypothetical protein BDF19DRAFT_219992 [Syncephalis fuscata]